MSERKHVLGRDEGSAAGEGDSPRRVILCAPASFKGTLSAAEVAAAMAAGIQKSGLPLDADVCPIADGGEGTLDALASALGATFHDMDVHGPLGQIIRARFAVAGSLGIVELAQAAGLMLVPAEERDPMRTTTYGVGELIRAAIERGCESIIVGVGGSATVDGGAGLAQALGAKFFDQAGNEMAMPMTGGSLRDVARIQKPDISSLWKENRSREGRARIRVACDVTNPLCGSDGAAAVYGPQKGASPQQVRELDHALTQFAALCGVEPNVPGAGAAGGAAYGLMALCGATLERGIDVVLSAIRFDDRVRGAALVLTGEGRLDEQSLSGKACLGVARAASMRGVPTFAIVGSTGPGAERCVGETRWGLLRDVLSLEDRYGRERALSEPAELVSAATLELIRHTSELNGER